jgi:hypothetical protein
MTGCVSNKWLDVFRLLHSVWAVVIRVFLILLVRVSHSLCFDFCSLSVFPRSAVLCNEWIPRVIGHQNGCVLRFHPPEIHGQERP